LYFSYVFASYNDDPSQINGAASTLPDQYDRPGDYNAALTATAIFASDICRSGARQGDVRGY
jgi:hypothetical protein